MSLFSKTRQPLPPNAEPAYHPIWSNFGFLFLTNFKLIPFFLPSMILLGFFLVFGGLLFLVGALLLLIPAGPAVTAMYDVGYQLVRELPKYESRTFWQSYRSNFRQGAVNMAVMLPVIMLLMLLMLTEAEKPLWVTLCLMLGNVILTAFSALSFSQIALVELPLGKIWKNAVLMIPLTRWRAIAAALAQIAFLAVLYQWVSVAFLMYLFAGPALLLAWSAHILWPSLEELLISGGEESPEAE